MAYDDEEREVLERVRRIETRVMTLGVKLGIEMKEEKWVKIVRSAGSDEPWIEIEDMDVSVSAVIRAARQAGLHGRRLDVFHNNTLVARHFLV